ncbi:hypothetical protein CIRG_00229 [Coccidioides immitis RMSCC 2394]|uniref:Uncharacterized protein n=1 Tax=Coccidioides immitis RMSCC 2394 TaxID=404692 RepID=A0A0J7AS86_COCIT|nr:hypothetical protein CIRG_00229 [Coccidioides immitis RMSCC 2394]
MTLVLPESYRVQLALQLDARKLQRFTHIGDVYSDILTHCVCSSSHPCVAAPQPCPPDEAGYSLLNPKTSQLQTANLCQNLQGLYFNLGSPRGFVWARDDVRTTDPGLKKPASACFEIRLRPSLKDRLTDPLQPQSLQNTPSYLRMIWNAADEIMPVFRSGLPATLGTPASEILRPQVK